MCGKKKLILFNKYLKFGFKCEFSRLKAIAVHHPEWGWGWGQQLLHRRLNSWRGLHFVIRFLGGRALRSRSSKAGETSLRRISERLSPQKLGVPVKLCHRVLIEPLGSRPSVTLGGGGSGSDNFF